MVVIASWLRFWAAGRLTWSLMKKQSRDKLRRLFRILLWQSISNNCLLDVERNYCHAANSGPRSQHLLRTSSCFDWVMQYCCQLPPALGWKPILDAPKSHFRTCLGLREGYSSKGLMHSLDEAIQLLWQKYTVAGEAHPPYICSGRDWRSWKLRGECTFGWRDFFGCYG